MTETEPIEIGTVFDDEDVTFKYFPHYGEVLVRVRDLNGCAAAHVSEVGAMELRDWLIELYPIDGGRDTEPEPNPVGSVVYVTGDQGEMYHGLPTGEAVVVLDDGGRYLVDGMYHVRRVRDLDRYDYTWYVSSIDLDVEPREDGPVGATVYVTGDEGGTRHKLARGTEVVVHYDYYLSDGEYLVKDSRGAIRFVSSIDLDVTMGV